MALYKSSEHKQTNLYHCEGRLKAMYFLKTMVKTDKYFVGIGWNFCWATSDYL